MSQKTVWMMENIMRADGDTTRYADLARSNQKEYRTLSHFLAVKLKGGKKGDLAKKLAVTPQTLNNWEKTGIPTPEQALHLALALELTLDETNEFFRDYAGMGTLYAADRGHAQYMYLLIYRETLERHFPYGEGESVEQWVSRVLQGLEDLEELGKPARQQEVPVWEIVTQERVATEVFLDALLNHELDTVKKLPFRSAGENACIYLETMVEGSRLQKNYGNRSHMDPAFEKSVRNVPVLMDRFYEEEKAQYENVLRRLENGTIVHRDELVELGMRLRLKREQMDELLKKSGEKPISARNLYEGALLLAWSFLSEMCPEWFCGKAKDDETIDRVEQKEAVLEREYKEELMSGGPIDLQVLFSRQVNKSIQQLPRAMKKQLREVPGWYLTEEQRERRLEKRRLSAILSELVQQLYDGWLRRNETVCKSASLRNVVDDLLEDYGYRPLDEARDRVILAEIDSVEAKWRETIRENPKQTKEACRRAVSGLDAYYLETYAQKKRGKMTGGQKPVD